MIVLGIESSCDETAAAVVANGVAGPEILSNLIQSQLAEHAPYGGIVPEIAARAHLDAGAAVTGACLTRYVIGHNSGPHAGVPPHSIAFDDRYTGRPAGPGSRRRPRC